MLAQRRIVSLAAERRRAQGWYPISAGPGPLLQCIPGGIPRSWSAPHREVLPGAVCEITGFSDHDLELGAREVPDGKRACAARRSEQAQ